MNVADNIANHKNTLLTLKKIYIQWADLVHLLGLVLSAVSMKIIPFLFLIRPSKTPEVLQSFAELPTINRNTTGDRASINGTGR